MTDAINVAFQISADLKGVQSQLRTLESGFAQSFGKIEGLARGLGRDLVSSLGVGLSVGAVAGFGKSVIDLAGKLQDLEDQTHISAQLLSGMNSIFEETGTSAEAFAKGIFTAQRNLGQINTDSDALAQAVKALGLNLDELRNASPQRFLELIAEALGKIDNPVQKAALGSALLGRQFKELAPALTAAAGRLEELKKQGISAEDIKKLDDFGDSLTRFGNILKIIVAGPLADLISGFERFFNLSQESKLINSLIAVEEEIERIDKMLEKRKLLREKGLGFFTAPLIDDAEVQRQRQALIDQRSVLDAARNRANTTTAKTQSRFVPLPDLAAQKKAGDELKKIMDEAAKSFADGLDEQQKAAEAAGKDMIEVFKALKKDGLTPAEQALADINARFDELINKAVNAGAATGQSMAPFIERLKFFRDQAKLAVETPTTGLDIIDADQGEQLKRAREEMIKLGQANSDYFDSQQKISAMSKIFGADFDDLGARIGNIRAQIEKLADLKLDPLGPEIQKLKGEFETLTQQQDLKKGLLGVFDGLSQGVSQTLAGIIQGTQDFGKGMKNIFLNMSLGILDVVTKTLIFNPFKKALENWLNELDLGGIFNGLGGAGGGGSLFSGLFSGGGDFFSGIIGSIGDFFGGFFADGGVVPGSIGAPKLAVVHGGETITPVGRASMAGGQVNYFTIDARGAQRGVSAEIRRAIDMSQQQAVKQSVAAVGDERSRSNNYARRFNK
jgi:hypothetical protein